MMSDVHCTSHMIYKSRIKFCCFLKSNCQAPSSSIALFPTKTCLQANRAADERAVDSKPFYKTTKKFQPLGHELHTIFWYLVAGWHRNMYEQKVVLHFDEVQMKFSKRFTPHWFFSFFPYIPQQSIQNSELKSYYIYELSFSNDFVF